MYHRRKKTVTHAFTPYPHPLPRPSCNSSVSLACLWVLFSVQHAALRWIYLIFIVVCRSHTAEMSSSWFLTRMLFTCTFGILVLKFLLIDHSVHSLLWLTLLKVFEISDNTCIILDSRLTLANSLQGPHWALQAGSHMNCCDRSHAGSPTWFPASQDS